MAACRRSPGRKRERFYPPPRFCVGRRLLSEPLSNTPYRCCHTLCLLPYGSSSQAVRDRRLCRFLFPCLLMFKRFVALPGLEPERHAFALPCYRTPQGFHLAIHQGFRNFVEPTLKITIMNKCVQLMTTNDKIVLVNLDKVLFARQEERYLRVYFAQDTSLEVRISMQDFQDLMAGKSK